DRQRSSPNGEEGLHQPGCPEQTLVNNFRSAARQQGSLLAPLEKKILLALARRMPKWINSDHLTLIGFLGMVLAGVCYFLAKFSPWALPAAVVCLGINWFGDSLDGTLARVRNRQRPRYGFYVDHILDAVGMFFLIGGIVLSGYLSAVVGFAFLISYLLLSIEVYFAAYFLGPVHLSYWRFGPTELRILLIVGNLFALRRPTALIGSSEYLLFDIGFGIGAVALAIILLQAMIAHTRQLYKEETRP